MDYYEELGINRSATEIEIHRAHRRLTKLLHPDQQTDRAMKLLAETQMRRMNAIVAVLSDPAQRRLYDRSLERLRAPSSFAPAAVNHPQAPLPQRFATHSLPWWIGSTIAAVILTVSVVWFWADNLGSSFGDRNAAYAPSETRNNGTNANRTTSSPTSPVSGSRTDALSRLRRALLPSVPSTTKAPVRSERTNELKPKYQPVGGSSGRDSGSENRVVVVVPDAPAPAGPFKGSSDQNGAPKGPDEPGMTTPSSGSRSAELLTKKVEIPPPPSVPTSALARNETTSVPFPALPVAVNPKASVPSAKSKGMAMPVVDKATDPVTPTAPATVSSPPMVVKALHQSPLEGEWVYAAKQQEKGKPGFYPPEFIDLKLFWNEGALHGQYRARYQITDRRPISPDISFILRPADKDARNFVWQSDDGRRGTMKISSIDAGSIRVEWRTTVFSRGPATLTAGMATLVRSSP